MDSSIPSPGPVGQGSALWLEGLRALDLTDDRGYLCGRILGDLGVDVIKVERPEGDPGRNIGPFYRDIRDPDKSLYWFAYNANKRGITLNLAAREGKDIFKKLIAQTDFLIESFAPGYMQSLDLGYKVLSRVNPGLIMTSITGFGQTGPYRDYEVSDMVGWAMGGQMYLCGDADRPPVQLGFPQSYMLAGSQAAMGALIAHYHRERTGEGQHVDVSIQESVALTLTSAPLFWEFYGMNLKRAGPKRVGLSVEGGQRQVWPCKDGYVVFAFYGGKLGEATNRGLVEWMRDDGMDTGELGAVDWESFDIGKASQEELDRFERPVGKLFRNHTKAELFDGAIKRRIMLYPAADTGDIRRYGQLLARDFWNEVRHPELGATIVYPASFALINGARPAIRRRAPLVGEHNTEVYEKELGLSPGRLAALKKKGVT